MFTGSIHWLRGVAIVVMLGAASDMAFAASQTKSLDTQRGIRDGSSGGTELSTAPLSQRGVTGTQSMGSTDGSGQYPYIVAPYIQVGPGGGPIPYPPNPPHPPQPPRPRPTPHAP